MVEHESYMRTAIELAMSRPAKPFAALLVDRASGHVVGGGVNATDANPLSHGEIVCLNAAASSSSRFDWKNTTLYTTAEPCCMCQAAILWSRVSEVVFGTRIATLRALGWDQFDLDARAVTDMAPFTRCSIIGDVLKDECDALFEAATKIPRHRA